MWNRILLVAAMVAVACIKAGISCCRCLRWTCEITPSSAPGAPPAGGSQNMADAGRVLNLWPMYPGSSGSTTGPANRNDGRLLAFAGVLPGQVIRCGIAMDRDGSWRIISTE